MLRFVRYGRWIVMGAMALQVGACLGPDPQFFLTASAVNALISSLITGLLQALLSGTA
jgi:hypothetical protein